MVSRESRLLDVLLVLGLVTSALGGCSSSSDSPGGTKGSGGASTSGSGGGSGGATSTGGATSSGGASASGGSVSSGGTKGTGGVQETGGTSAGKVDGTGGTSSSAGGMATGGAATGGSGKGGSSSGTGGGAGGVATGTGGKAMGTGGAAKGGSTGGGTGGSATGGSTASGGNGGSSGSCQKGQVKASEVVFMGESFYAIDPQYNEKRVEANAQKAGALAAGAKYRNVAASGQPMSYIAGTEWDQAKTSSVKLVIMDGGGIDCLTSSSCPTCASQFTTLLGKMATAGVQDVIYTRYPEPGAPPGSNASLKKCLDTVMPTMQPVCEGSTSPKCHWVDLRPVFVAGDTTDGLHPTQTGGDHVGDAIWAEMVKDCLAQ